MTGLSAAERDKLRELLAKATPEPWNQNGDEPCSVVWKRSTDVAETWEEADAQLIVALRNHADALLVLADRVPLLEAVAEASEEYERCADWYRRDLESIIDRSPVRDLAEARAGFDNARDRLLAALDAGHAAKEET